MRAHRLQTRPEAKWTIETVPDPRARSRPGAREGRVLRHLSFRPEFQLRRVPHVQRPDVGLAHAPGARCRDLRTRSHRDDCEARARGLRLGDRRPRHRSDRAAGSHVRGLPHRHLRRLPEPRGHGRHEGRRLGRVRALPCHRSDPHSGLAAARSRGDHSGCALHPLCRGRAHRRSAGRRIRRHLGDRRRRNPPGPDRPSRRRHPRHRFRHQREDASACPRSWGRLRVRLARSRPQAEGVRGDRRTHVRRHVRCRRHPARRSRRPSTSLAIVAA